MVTEIRLLSIGIVCVAGIRLLLLRIKVVAIILVIAEMLRRLIKIWRWIVILTTEIALVSIGILVILIHKIISCVSIKCVCILAAKASFVIFLKVRRSLRAHVLHIQIIITFMALCSVNVNIAQLRVFRPFFLH